MIQLRISRIHSPALAQFVCTWVLIFAATARADDWPQWLGPRRDGVWRESDIVERFPEGGPPVLWRAPVNRSYCGPAVVGKRLYMLDRQTGKPFERKKGDQSIPAVPGNERVVCLEADTGNLVWERAYDCPYRIAYSSGPRATPVVADGRVYTLGAMGDLLCLNAQDGKIIWSRSFLKDFDLAEPPLWGWAGHPLLDGDRLVCLVGGSNTAVVAFHKDTGKELWRALSAQEIGYAPPMLYEIGGRRQLIIWHPDAVCGLDPVTGQVLWQHKYPNSGKPQRPEVTIASPRLNGNRLFISSYYHGSLLLELKAEPPGASLLWDRHSTSKSKFNAGLHTVMCTPLFKPDHIYGVCGMGELRCLDARTGERLWESYAATDGKPGLFANAFIIEHADRCILWNDQGELMIARLTPAGYAELSRAQLLPTIEHTRGRDVLWCHPAFANRCVYVHNGKELICVDLRQEGPR